jgi:hypothetical protein
MKQQRAADSLGVVKKAQGFNSQLRAISLVYVGLLVIGTVLCYLVYPAYGMQNLFVGEIGRFRLLIQELETPWSGTVSKVDSSWKSSVRPARSPRGKFILGPDELAAFYWTRGDIILVSHHPSLESGSTMGELFSRLDAPYVLGLEIVERPIDSTAEAKFLYRVDEITKYRKLGWYCYPDFEAQKIGDHLALLRGTITCEEMTGTTPRRLDRKDSIEVIVKTRTEFVSLPPTWKQPFPLLTRYFHDLKDVKLDSLDEVIREKRGSTFGDPAPLFWGSKVDMRVFGIVGFAVFTCILLYLVIVLGRAGKSVAPVAKGSSRWWQGLRSMPLRTLQLLLTLFAGAFPWVVSQMVVTVAFPRGFEFLCLVPIALGLFCAYRIYNLLPSLVGQGHGTPAH